MISELALLVGIKRSFIEGSAGHLETVKVGRVELLESTNEGLHVELGVNFVFAYIDKANLDFVTKFGSLLFCFCDLSFGALGKLNFYL